MLLKLAGMGCCPTSQSAGSQLSQKSAFWPLLGLYTWPGFSIVHTCLQQWYFYVCENSYFILTIIHRQEKTCPFFFFSFHWAKHWSKILGQIMLWFCNFKICLCKLVLNLVLFPQAFFHAIKISPFFFFLFFSPSPDIWGKWNSKEGTKSTARLQLSVVLAL